MIGLLLLTLVGLSLAQLCPPAEVLLPCSCSEPPYSTIACLDIKGEFDLKSVFDNASQFVDDDDIFRKLHISGTSLTELVEGAIEHLKCDYVEVSGNPNLEYISTRAFGVTRNVTSGGLDLPRNNFRNQSNIFDLINSFEKLRQLSLEGNGITAIPSYAFQNHPFLEIVNLQSNNISRIGSHAFNTGSGSLSSVNFYGNSIPSGGLAEDAFDCMASADIGLQCNNEMEFMEQKSFQTLLDRAGSVTVGGNFCPIGESSPRFICDERADWICDKEDIYRGKLRGFRCKPESGFEDIWDYCAGRNKSFGEIY